MNNGKELLRKHGGEGPEHLPHIVILDAAGKPPTQDRQGQRFAGFPDTPEDAEKLLTMISDAGPLPPTALSRLREVLSAQMSGR